MQQESGCDRSFSDLEKKIGPLIPLCLLGVGCLIGFFLGLETISLVVGAIGALLIATMTIVEGVGAYGVEWSSDRKIRIHRKGKVYDIDASMIKSIKFNQFKQLENGTLVGIHTRMALTFFADGQLVKMQQNSLKFPEEYRGFRDHVSESLASAWLSKLDSSSIVWCSDVEFLSTVCLQRNPSQHSIKHIESLETKGDSSVLLNFQDDKIVLRTHEVNFYPGYVLLGKLTNMDLPEIPLGESDVYI